MSLDTLRHRYYKRKQTTARIILGLLLLFFLVAFLNVLHYCS